MALGSNTYTRFVQRRAAESTVALQLRLTGRCGFSNAVLAALLGLLALVSALALIQSGQLDIAGLFAKPAPAAARTKSGAKGKPQKLLPRVSAPAPVSAALPAKQVLAATSRSPRRELYEALPRMDADAAARMLAEMDVEDVVLLLQQLKERDLARILEAASPLDSSRWVKEMLETLPPVPGNEPMEGQLDPPSGNQGKQFPMLGEKAETEVSTDTTVEPVGESESGPDGENQPESDSDTDTSETPAEGSNPSGTPSQLPPGTNTA